MAPEPRNRLLQLLTPDERRIVYPKLELVAIKRNQVLEEPRLQVRYAHFIETGIVSVQARGQHLGILGLGLIGPSGMTGIPIVLETGKSPLRLIVQVAGESFRISAEDLSSCMLESGSFRRLMLGYVQMMLVQSAHIALCNVHHTLDERLKRWLLLAHTITGEDEICVTHSLIASLLGVRRPSVSERLGALSAAKGIEQKRACINIIDRSLLEDGVCGCYRIIDAEFSRLLRRE